MTSQILKISRSALQEQARRALDRLVACDLCPRRCGVNRLKDERGFCTTGRLARVAGHAPHFGEEEPLVGFSGSGTIFFSGCNLSCVFCQNYDISQQDRGTEVSSRKLADMMLALQDAGCHNINLVTPTHVIAQILEALLLAKDGGLSIPLVYNSGGFDSVDALRLLDGIVDIYLPDAKYGNDEAAREYSKAPGYVGIMKSALLEMHRQVRDLILDERGLAERGMIVRHLVLPENAAGTEDVMRFIAQEISKDTYVNIMAQYRPEYRAACYARLARPITEREYVQAVGLAAAAGLTRGLAML